MGDYQPGTFAPVEPNEHGFRLEVFDVTKDDEKTFRWVRVVHPDGHIVCAHMSPAPEVVAA